MTISTAKDKKTLKVLILTPFFSPNVGGVETHFDDLTEFLLKRGHKVFVITYQPLTTRLKAKAKEKKGNLFVRRISWFGHNWFPKLEKRPFWVCLYLLPGLFLYSFYFLIKQKVLIWFCERNNINCQEENLGAWPQKE